MHLCLVEGGSTFQMNLCETIHESATPSNEASLLCSLQQEQKVNNGSFDWKIGLRIDIPALENSEAIQMVHGKCKKHTSCVFDMYRKSSSEDFDFVISSVQLFGNRNKSQLQKWDESSGGREKGQGLLRIGNASRGTRAHKLIEFSNLWNCCFPCIEERLFARTQLNFVSIHTQQQQHFHWPSRTLYFV